jgi:hypothetical protein
MSDPKILQLHIHLLGIEPPIWRRIEISEDANLAELHDAVQASMGWTDSHLHQFRIGRKVYGPRTGEEDFDDEAEDEEALNLSDAFARKGSKLLYDYDFGDSWQHAIKLESVLEAEEGIEYPRCTEGQGACPPEDCGGPPGYAALLEALSDPEHPEHEEYVEWIGDPNFDPAYFDVQAANDRFAYGDEAESEETDYEVLGDAIVEIVEAQVEDANPPEARHALERMAAKGLDEDSAWDLLAAAYALELYRSFVEHRDFEEPNYRRILHDLPTLPGA